jgi:hypothetical protein
MKQIPTAEEWIKKHYEEDVKIHFINFSRRENKEQTYKEYAQIHPLKKLEETMIEFAKLHVEAFRQEILKNGKIKEEFFSTEDTSLSSIKEIIANGGYGRYNIYGDVYGVDKVSIDRDSILNNYPLENIK